MLIWLVRRGSGGSGSWQCMTVAARGGLARQRVARWCCVQADPGPAGGGSGTLGRVGGLGQSPPGVRDGPSGGALSQGERGDGGMAQVSEEAVRALKDAAEALEQDTTNDEEIKDALRRAVQQLVAEATGSAGYAQIIEVLLTLD